MGSSRGKVLILDASLTVRMDLKDAFEKAGYEALLADSADSARQTLIANTLDLLVIDPLLPDSRAMELLNELSQRTHDQQSPILLLATADETAAMQGRLPAGQYEYVGKPYAREQVIARANALVQDRRRPRAEDPTTPAEARVLLVDDSPTFLHALAARLRQEGYTVLAAPSAEAGIALLAEKGADCVLMDLMMPDVSGDEACRRIRNSNESWRGVPVVMLTGNENREAMLASFSAGADDFVAKAGDPSVLLARLRAQLRRKRSDEENRLMRDALHQKEIEAAEARVMRQLAETRAALLRDLEQKHQQLRESEERFRTLADNIAQFAWMADATGAIIWYNRRWYDYTGTTFEEMKGWRWEKVQHPDHLERVVEKYQRCLREGQVWEDTFPLRGADGQYRWFLSRAIPIRNEQGHVVRWFGTNTDITHQRETEEQLRLAKSEMEMANAAKDHFLAVLSHELRTPLTPVIAIAGILEEDHRLPAEARRDMQTIRRNISLEKRLIDDLLDITRITHGKLEMEMDLVELGTVVRQAADICAADMAAKEILLNVDIATDVWVNGDAARLQQIFWNLLNNASKFTPPGGRISVSLKTADDRALVQVSDSGIGIAPDAISRIFGAFEQQDRKVTRQFGGLGLGLAICKVIAERHCGTITASSEGIGKGATFTVDLPVVEKPADEEGKPPAPDFHHVGVRPLRILLVEDHGDTAKVMTRLLASRGHKVEHAEDVGSALQLVECCQFDLLISDLGLPDGSGIDLMRAIRGKGLSLPAIALSGYGQAKDQQDTRVAGFAAHITKPVDIPKLEQIIETVITGGT